MESASKVQRHLRVTIIAGLLIAVAVCFTGWRFGWGVSDLLRSATANGVGNILFLPFTIVLTVWIASWQIREQLRAQADHDVQIDLRVKREQAEAHVADAHRQVLSNLDYLRMLESYFWNGPGGKAASENSNVNTFGVGLAMAAGIQLDSINRALQGEIRPYLPTSKGDPLAAIFEEAHRATLRAQVTLGHASREIVVVKSLSQSELSSNYNGARRFYDIEFELRALCLGMVREARRSTAAAALALGVLDQRLHQEASQNTAPPPRNFQHLLYMNDVN